jgi:hypothetical protein
MRLPDGSTTFRATLTLALIGLGACTGEPTRLLAPPADGTLQAKASTIPAGETIVVTWSSATLQAFRVTKIGPPMGARALAIVHTAIYDAWAAYDARAVGTRLGGTLRRPAAESTEANKHRAVSYAAYRALVDLFPTEVGQFSALMTRLGYDPADVSTDPRTATGIGNLAAKAVIEYRRTDGSNQHGEHGGAPYSDYESGRHRPYAPVNSPDEIVDPTRWQPLRVNDAVQKFMAPHWGRVTPFAMKSADQYRPRPVMNHYPFSGVEQEVDRILEYSRNLGDREKAIAEYWADGPNSELPPGHWCLFAASVSKRDGHGIDEDAKMFFILGNAVLDASIASWESKRYFDSIRPGSAVRYYKKGKMIKAWAGPGKGVQLIRGEDWQPYQPTSFPTPPFPEYTSGHSTFSAASAEVLRRFTKSDVFGDSVTVRAGSSKVEPGLAPAKDVVLHWPTFSAAADEAGLSRRYGGIHFVPGDLLGRSIGTSIGADAFNKATHYFNGSAR